MGAIFAVPLARAGTIDLLPGKLVALVPDAGTSLPDLSQSASDPRKPTAEVGHHDELTLLIGAEREGLPDDITRQADVIAHIPIRTHSLNAAMAATVALYEVRARLTRMARAK
jgi:TrmH family RNA methyltransferase